MTRWGKLSFAVCASFALMAGTASAELLTFDVIPAFAPKGLESPSWPNYVVNALSGIQAKMDIGDRETWAAAYERVDGPIGPEEIIYTPTFKSWRGKADPNPEFQAPFLNEHGNRVHFGLHIVGSESWDFALADITWELASDDADGYFNQSGDFSAATYSPTRIGIDYGPDGMAGGGDDMILSSGEAGTHRVNELIYVGVGDGFKSDEPDLEGQDDINATLADILAGCVDKSGGCPVNLTGTYTVPGHDGNRVAASGNVVINLVPEPATGLLSLIGFFGVAAFGRRR